MLMRSSAVTLSAGERTTDPLTETRPVVIQASSSRREQSPARAITLAMRSASFEGGGAASTTGRGKAVLRCLPRNLRPAWRGPPASRFSFSLLVIIPLGICMSMILSDLPSPAGAGFAKAGNRFPLFGIMLYGVRLIAEFRPRYEP